MCAHVKNKLPNMSECENCKDRSFRNKIKTLYGVSIEQYNQMFSDQGGVCAICGQQEVHSYRRRLSIDHNHETGVVRGLLCHSCNTGLGKFKDSSELLSAAADYLRRSE